MKKNVKKQETLCAALHGLLRNDKSLPHTITTDEDEVRKTTWSYTAVAIALDEIMGIFGYEVVPID